MTQCLSKSEGLIILDHCTVKLKQETFPNKKLAPAFDWLCSWIEAADWAMVPKFKYFAGFLH